MCRFLLVKSNKPVKPESFLSSFSCMAQKSRAYDDDWQGDGWGIAWLNNNKWQVKKFLSPVWENREIFKDFPESQLFVIHARSASFTKHKNNIDYNQPFIDGKYAFVFNGLLKGVKLSSSIPGKIGAQKIWFLLKNFLINMPPQIALEKIKGIIIKNTTEVQAFNIGIADKQNLYSLCYYSRYPNYYNIRYINDPEIKIICSEEIKQFNNFKITNPGKILML